MRLFWIVIAIMAAAIVILTATHDEGQTFGLQSDQFASMLYMSLWGGVILIGLISSRVKMAQMLRDLAYWLLILLIIMSFYQYRYELQDFASRITAGLIPGSPLTLNHEEKAAVMVNKSANGHFEARLIINGQTLRMLVDTGASSTVLSYSDANKIGIDTDTLQFSTPIMTANGRSFAARATVQSMLIGGIERYNQPILIAESGKLHQSLLGMQFLGTLSSFEVRGDRLILRD